MRRRKRMIALLFCIGMVLMLSASSVLIVQGMRHTCAGKRCRTCVRIAETIALLSSFALLGAALRAAPGRMAMHRAESVRADGDDGACCTLVGWKIRLNN